MGQEEPLEKEMANPLVFLPGESHGQRSLMAEEPGWLQSMGVQRVGHD